MKAIYRLLRVLGCLMTLPLIIFEVTFYGIRWIFTGKNFPDFPLCAYILFNDL